MIDLEKEEKLSKIEEEFNKNYNKLEETDKKIRLLEENTMYNKLTKIASFGMIPYFVVLYAISVLKLFNIPFIPEELLSLTLFGGTTILGVITQKVYTKKRFKLNKKYTENELIENLTKEKIKREKIHSYCNVLRRRYQNLKLQQIDYDISIKSDIKHDSLKEKRNKQIEELSTKEVLKRNLPHVRNNFDKKSSKIAMTTLGTIFLLVAYNMPFILVHHTGDLLFDFILPIIVSLGVSGSLVNKIINAESYAYDKIKNTLSDSDINSELDYKKELENTMSIALKEKMLYELSQEKEEQIEEPIYELDYNIEQTKELPMSLTRKK